MEELYLAQAKHKDETSWGIGRLCIKEDMAMVWAEEMANNSIYFRKDMVTRVVKRYVTSEYPEDYKL